MDLHEQIGTLEQKLAAEEAKNASLRREIADAMASRTPRPDWAGVQKLATTALKVGLSRRRRRRRRRGCRSRT